MKVIFDHAEQIAPDIFTYSFTSVEPVKYIAGQFTQINLPHDKMDERGDKRWFTLSSSPSEKFLSITTKFSKNHPSSFKMALQSLTPGTQLNLADPMGDFVLPKDSSIPLLFVAAGMGITPMRSMVSELTETNSRRTIHLLHSVRNSEELIWRELFEGSGIDYIPIITTYSPDWKGESGRLTAERIASVANIDSSLAIYLAGPEIMVEKLVGELPELGIEHNRLMTDYFQGYEAI